LAEIPFRIWSRQSAVKQTALASHIGPKMIEFYENLFDMKSAIPKQDLVAIPDFAGAMENWGLVTYQEQFLLYQPGLPIKTII
jgi:aminopeptidase N